MNKWTIGKPGGLNGPFYSVVSSDGEVIAMQIPSRKNAERIANIPKMAHVDFRQGRYLLVVSGLILAMEGDPIRDPHVIGLRWEKASLQYAADVINYEAVIP